MKWNDTDLEKYVNAKEYIDSIILPLIPFQLSRDTEIKQNAFSAEIINIFSNEIEQELTGRLFLTPSYYYLKGANKEEEATRINQWVENIQKQPFKHVFFLSFDSSWKKYEKELDGELLWLPGFQSGDIHSKEMQTLIREQVKQISELIRSYW